MLTRLQTVAMTIALNCFDHRNVARCCTSRTTVATQLWNTRLFNQPTRLQANQAYWTNHTVHFNQANCHAISAAPHTEASYLAHIWSRFAQRQNLSKACHTSDTATPYWVILPRRFPNNKLATKTGIPVWSKLASTEALQSVPCQWCCFERAEDPCHNIHVHHVDNIV
jgi:hypothetical protein